MDPLRQLAAMPVMIPDYNEDDLQEHILRHLSILGAETGEREVTLSGGGRTDILYKNKENFGPIEAMVHDLDDGHTARGEEYFLRIQERYGKSGPIKFVATGYGSRFVRLLQRSFYQDANGSFVAYPFELWKYKADPVRGFIYELINPDSLLPSSVTKSPQNPTFESELSKIYAPSNKKRSSANRGQVKAVVHPVNSRELVTVALDDTRLVDRIPTSNIQVLSERDGAFVLGLLKLDPSIISRLRVGGLTDKNRQPLTYPQVMYSVLDRWGIDIDHLQSNQVLTSMPLILIKNHPFGQWWSFIDRDLKDNPDMMVDIAPARWRWSLQHEKVRAKYLPGVYRILHLPHPKEWLDANPDLGLDIVYWDKNHQGRPLAEFCIYGQQAEQRNLNELPVIPNTTLAVTIIKKLLAAVERHGPWAGASLSRFGVRDPYVCGYSKLPPGTAPVFTTAGKLTGGTIQFVADSAFKFPSPSESTLIIGRSCTYGLVPLVARGLLRGHNGAKVLNPGVRCGEEYLVLAEGSAQSMENGRAIINNPIFRYALEQYTGTTDVCQERFNILPYFDLARSWSITETAKHLDLESELPAILALMTE